jgi:phage-related protein
VNAVAVIVHKVKLDDGVSGPAKSASAAVSGVSREMTILTKQLTAAQDKMTKAAALGDAKGFKNAQVQFNKTSMAIAKLPPDASGAGAAIQKMGQDAQGAGGGMAGLSTELAELTGGLSLVVEVAAAVVLGLGALVIAGAAFAIKASEAKNASISLWNALGQGKITGEAVDDMLDNLRESTGLTKEALGPLTEGFLRMGITSKDALENLTKAAASAEAMAKGGGEAFTKLFQQVNTAAETGQKLSIPYKKLQAQLVAMGLNVDDLAQQMGMSGDALTKGLKAGTVDAKKFGDAMQDAVLKKGAGPLATMAASSANLGKLLQEYLGDLFEDLGKDIAPFMNEVKSLFSILDSKANPSGQALKEGIGAFFKQVFAAATKVVPMVKHFLLDVIIYGLKAYIALKPIARWFLELRNNEKVMSALSTGFKIFLGVLLVIAGAIALVLGFVVLVVAAIWAMMIGVVMLGKTLFEFVDGAYSSFGEWLASIPGLALDFINGLVTGIKNGAGMVYDAVTGLGKGAISAFKGALGISSPSKEMAKLGGFTAEGLAGGMDDKSGMVANSSGSMAGVVMSSASGAAPSASGNTSSSGGGGGAIANFEAGSIVINGAGKSAEEISDEMMALAWERAAATAGG